MYNEVVCNFIWKSTLGSDNFFVRNESQHNTTPAPIQVLHVPYT